MTLAHTFMVALNQMPDGKPHTLEVLVDTKGLYEEVLRRMLAVEDAIDWSTYFLGVININLCLCNMIHFNKSLNMLKLYMFAFFLSDLEPRLSVLNESHANVVNKTWKFGGDDKGHRNILNLIRHFPTCCITDENNQPVSWVLLYDYCAMGILYTQPEHRGKGYAKALVTTMAQRLHSQGYPVYCFIEECNLLSYKLFKSMVVINIVFTF
uniref:Glycine N-acyltransferase-like protein n=1 Tax=Sinocyclocheilus grahami TaxID=75366 RepID=A0A672MSJ5_SINGR